MTSPDQRPATVKYDTFNPFILRRIPEGASVLDVGCATGLLGKNLSAREKRGLLVGVEHNPEAARLAEPHYDQVFVLDIEKEHLPAMEDRRFDVIVLADVLEHLRYPVEVLRQLVPFLSDAGVILVSVPNVAFVSIRLSLLLGRFTYQKGGGIMDDEHLRFYTRRSLKDMFEEAGLEVARIQGYNLVRPRFYFLKALGRLAPALFCLQFLAEARKEVDS